MKNSTLIWAASAIVYLGVVIAGYSVYASMQPDKGERGNEHGADEHAANEHAAALDDHIASDDQAADNSHSVDGHNNEHNNEHSAQHSEHSHDGNQASEVAANISYADGEIAIELKDKNNAVPQLELSHEKLMHLIVVSSDLQQYYHLHPQEQQDGTYVQQFELPDNAYRAFVDIKPVGLSYAVQPLELHIGEAHQPQASELAPDREWIKTVNGQAVELKPQAFEVDQPISLEFHIKDATPERYLGALGHVVILDEKAERFIHVHPAAEDQTIFATEFSEPGLYKLWAEFQFNGVVNVYPYVIEVK